MSNEEEAKSTKTNNPNDHTFETGESAEDIAQALKKAEEELAYFEAKLKELEEEEEIYDFGDEDEDWPPPRRDLSAFTDEELKAQAEVLAEQIEQAEKRIETNNRAYKLGLLEKANRSPRCTHARLDGEPCRAPALKGRTLCLFHGSASDTRSKPEIQVEVLENRESMQIAVKQIMEHIISGKMHTRDAAVLLRAVQIAGSTLKSGKGTPTPAMRKQARAESGGSRRNAEQSAG